MQRGLRCVRVFCDFGAGHSRMLGFTGGRRQVPIVVPVVVLIVMQV